MKNGSLKTALSLGLLLIVATIDSALARTFCSISTSTFTNSKGQLLYNNQVDGKKLVGVKKDLSQALEIPVGNANSSQQMGILQNPHLVSFDVKDSGEVGISLSHFENYGTPQPTIKIDAIATGITNEKVPLLLSLPSVGLTALCSYSK